MKIFVVGLGLMGASYAQKLHQQGHTVYGYDQDKTVMKDAQHDHVIDATSDLKKLMVSDVIILALYPDNTIEFVEAHQHLFKKGALLTDINGVKKHLVKEIDRILRQDVRYVSHHPMAGRAKKGYYSRDISMFNNNHFLIVETPRGELSDYELLNILARQLGFKTVTKVTPESHDALIAYTSQLTHIIAAALINGHANIPVETTGDSFRDLTRIANINESLWTELFLNNKEALLDALKAFKSSFEQFESFIRNQETEQLKEHLKKSREKREQFEKNS